jgi:polyferredoxin
MLPKKRSSNKKSPKLSTKTPLRFSSMAVFVFIFAAVGGYVLWHTFAAPAPPTIYLSPASQTLGPNTSFTVQVREHGFRRECPDYRRFGRR